MAIYRTLQPCFIAPQHYPAEAVIHYNGPPGPHLEPIDDEAKAAMEVYWAENPHASLNPVEGLDKTMQAEPITSSLIRGPLPSGEMAGNLAVPGPRQQGLGEVGSPGLAPTTSVKPASPEEVAALVAAGAIPAFRAGAGGPIVTPDPPGVGSNAPGIEGTMQPEPLIPRVNVLADDPAMGDPTKPGEKGSEKKAEADKANTLSMAEANPPADKPK